MATQAQIEHLKDKAVEMRKRLLRLAHEAGSLHIGGDLSMTEMMTVIFEYLHGTVIFQDPTSYTWVPSATGLFRPGGVYGNPPAAGTALAIAILLGIPLISRARGSRRLALLSCELMLIVALFLTFERVAFIALAVGYVSYKLITLRDLRTALTYALVCASAVIAAVLLVPQLKSNETFENGIVRPGTFQSRVDIWYEEVPIVTANIKNALLGVGFGGTVVARSGGDPPNELAVVPDLVSQNIHNQYLLFLLELGLIGAVLFLAFMGALLWRGLRTAVSSQDDLTAALTASVLVYAVICLTSTPMLDPSSLILFMLVAGVLGARTIDLDRGASS